MGHVVSIVENRHGECTVDEEEGTIYVPSLECVLGLSNLAQTCRAADEKDWRVLIYRHIARLDDFSPEALAERLGDYERVAPDLRIRIVGPQHVEQIDPVCDSLPLGFKACLSVDLDGAACPIDQTYFDRWGRSRDEVMGNALRRTLEDGQIASEEIVGDNGRYRVFCGDSLFTATRLLDFESLLPDVGEWGAMVTVPAAHTLMVCPVQSGEQFVDDSATMLATSYVRYLAGPNSVSPNALWWRPGHDLEGFARMDHGSFELVAPPVLRDYLGVGLGNTTGRHTPKGDTPGLDSL